MHPFRGPIRLADVAPGGSASAAELFVVEGESAFQAVVNARDPVRQAVLPMQGKPLNAHKASRARVESNELYAALRDAIGVGWEDALDLEQRRFERVLLLFDPDADGIHCGALMLMFFLRFMRPLLEAGHVWVVRAPFATVDSAQLERAMQAYSREDLHALIAQLEKHGVTDPTRRYYRGLASMDAAVLAESCLVPATRRATQMTPADAERALQVFGSAESAG